MVKYKTKHRAYCFLWLYFIFFKWKYDVSKMCNRWKGFKEFRRSESPLCHYPSFRGVNSRWTGQQLRTGCQTFVFMRQNNCRARVSSLPRRSIIHVNFSRIPAQRPQFLMPNKTALFALPDVKYEEGNTEKYPGKIKYRILERDWK